MENASIFAGTIWSILPPILAIGLALMLSSGTMMLLYNFAIPRYLLVAVITLAAVLFRKRIIKTIKEMK